MSEKPVASNSIDPKIDHIRTAAEAITLLEEKLRGGEPIFAYDIASEALKNFPGDIRLRQLQGLSLARSGATERARSILEKLRRDGSADEETLGILLGANAHGERLRNAAHVSSATALVRSTSTCYLVVSGDAATTNFHLRSQS